MRDVAIWRQSPTKTKCWNELVTIIWSQHTRHTLDGLYVLVVLCVCVCVCVGVVCGCVGVCVCVCVGGGVQGVWV